MTEKDKRLAGVADRLRDARRKRGLTQEALAVKSGVGVATIRRIEGSVSETKIDTIVRLADALGVDLKTLAFGDGEETY